MMRDEARFVGVGLAVVEERGSSTLPRWRLVVRGLLGKIAALGVVEDERLDSVVCRFDRVREIDEEARFDTFGGREAGVVEGSGGEGHDLPVHAVLDCQHAFDGGAVEGEEAREEGCFESGWGIFIGIEAGFGGRFGSWLGIGRFDGRRELHVVTCQDELRGCHEWDPALGFESLACFVDNHDVEMCATKLGAASTMKSGKDDFTITDEGGDALLFALAVFLPQLLHLPIYSLPLPSVARFLDTGLLIIHFLSDVFNQTGGFRRLRQDIQGVVEDGGEEARWVPESQDRNFLRC